MKCENVKRFISTIFIILFCFLMLFGFNTDRLTESIIYSIIVIPYFNVNITMFLAITSTLCAIILILFKAKLDSTSIALFLRIFFYSIPILYIIGDFKIGVFYSVIQCFLAYFIGLNSEKNINTLTKILIVYTTAICLEVFYVLIANKITMFSETLKWFMIIPMGRYNYITCMLLPTYIFVTNIYKSKFKFKIIYSIIIFLAILSTGSRLALLLFIGYNIYDISKLYFKKKKITKNKILRDFLLIIVIIVGSIFIYQQKQDAISTLLSKFNFESLTKSRFLVYKDIFELISQNPIFGRSAFAYKAFDAIKAHNFILESLVQTGIVGTAIFFFALYKSIKKVSLINNKQIKNAFLGFIIMYLIQGLMEPNLFGSTSDTFFWLITGIGINQYTKNQTQTKEFKYDKKNY